MSHFKDNFQFQPSPGKTARFLPQVFKLLLVAIVYFVVVRLGLLVVAQPEGVASIWPASGLVLAILLLSPKYEWPKLLMVIFFVNAAGNINGGNSLPVSLGFALANILEALLGAWALTYFIRSKITFTSVVEIFALFEVAVFSNGLTALLGAAVPALAFGAPFLGTWWIWWIADGLGMILVTPLIVIWATRPNLFPSPPRRIVEGLLVVFALVLFAWLLFGKFTTAEEPVLRNYMLFPFLIWLGFRFSPRGMASTLTLLAAIAIWNTMQGYGIFGFAGKTVTENLGSVQILLSVMSLTGLLLSAIVTERKLMEKKLRESEDKFKYVFDHSVAGKSFTLPSGEINANQAFCDMLGYSAEELSHRTWQEITHPDDLELTQNAINSLLSGEKESLRFTKRYIHKDGSIVWIDLGTAIRRDNDARPLYFITTILEITARKHAEEALRKSEEKYSRIFQTSPYAITVTKAEDGKFIEVNDAFTSITGITHEEALSGTSVGLNLWVHEEDRQRVVTALRTGKTVVGKEFLFRRKNGEILTGLFSAQVIQLEQEACILSSIDDITERKQAEEALRQSEEKFHSLADQSPNMIFINKRGRIVYANAKCEEVLGYQSEEFYAPGFDFNKLIAPDCVTLVKSFYREHQRGVDIPSYEYALITKGGNRIEAINASKLIRFEDDEAILGIVTDISERKRAEQEIRALNANLEKRVEERTRELLKTQDTIVRQEKLAMLGQVVGSISHELRNPLGVIANAVYYLKLVQPEAGEKVKNYLNMIEIETHNADKIITDLLGFTRNKPVNREPVAVLELVQRVLSRFPAPASIEVVLNIPTALAKGFVDPLQMEQVLGNLTVNACQAMLKGGKLSISARRKKEMLVIAITDSGTGISPENMEKLFEPLFTTKPSGIGLGLPVSQKLAEANGGHIEARSKVGVGSTFSLYLPISTE